MGAAPADGYTWVVGSVAPIVPDPLFYKTSYQSLRDFTPVSVIALAPQLIVVNPLLSVKSIQDLAAFAKSKPGAINYGSSGTGTLPHLGGEMFSTAVGAKITRIQHKGSAPALLDFAPDNWWGLLTLKSVPQKIVDKLNAEIVKSLKQPDVIERYTALGIESVTSTPQEFTDIIKSDLAKYPKVIKDAGIKMEP